MIQLVPEKNTYKSIIQLLQCWVNSMGSLSILSTKISLQYFSKRKRNDNLNVQHISREALLFINFRLPCIFCSIHRSSAPLRCYDDPNLSFWLSLYYSFWLLFLSCEVILFFFLLLLQKKQATKYFPQVLNYLSHYQLALAINWSFLRASPNTLCEICSVFRHFASNFLLVLQWLLYFQQIDPTCFCSSIFEWLPFQYIRR